MGKDLSLIIFIGLLWWIAFTNTRNQTSDYSFKSEDIYELHNKNFMRYTDSFIKYVDINTKCGIERRNYYSNLMDAEYRLMYPNGNPADKTKKDTVCYPMKE